MSGWLGVLEILGLLLVLAVLLLLLLAARRSTLLGLATGTLLVYDNARWSRQQSYYDENEEPDE